VVCSENTKKGALRVFLKVYATRSGNARIKWFVKKGGQLLTAPEKR
jgi:hypothetical protein